MPRTQVGDIKQDWFCNRRLDPKGGKFTNFGKRSTCFKCHVDKGKCFHSDVRQPPPRSLAHRQAQQQRGADDMAKKLRDKDAKISVLAARLKEHEKNAGKGDKKDKEDEMDKEDDEFEYTVEQLQRQRRMLFEFGKTVGHRDVDKLDQQIEQQQAAKLPFLPPHVRVAKADKKVKAAKQRLEIQCAQAGQDG